MGQSHKPKKKKFPWQQCLIIAIYLITGGICGFVIASSLESSASETTLLHQEILSIIELFLGIYVALFIHIIIHEAGHLLFGLLTGYKFSSFRILSFMWIKENGKIKLKRHKLVGTGGQCLMSPPDIVDGKMPTVLYNLGGVFLNIITSVLFLIGYLLCYDVPFISTFFFAFAIIGFSTALINGIPMRTDSISNDGYNAFSLSKDKKALESMWFQLKVNEQLSKGLRPKDMPAEWFTVPTDEEMKNSIVAVRGVFTCNRLMDEGKFEEADALMAHLLEIESGIVGIYRSLMICDRLYVELISQNRQNVIEDMLTKEQKKFMKAMKNYPSVLRTQYTLALLFEEDVKKAEEIKNTFEKVSKTYPHPSDIETERELIEKANQRISQ